MFFFHRKSILQSRFLIEPGKNYGLLIDQERFPINTKAGQTLEIKILDENFKNLLPKNRVVIPNSGRELESLKMDRSRFRFSYDSPSRLKKLYERESLASLRGASNWQTVINVMRWSNQCIKVPGSPDVYVSQDANELIPQLRSGKLQGFCAHYCYLTVQALQALGYFARYVTIQGHEICEVWVPDLKKWVALDPMHNVYFEDSSGLKLSALEIARAKEGLRYVSPTFQGPLEGLASSYSSIWYWLRNDLVTNPINVYDLNKFRCRAILKTDQVEQQAPGDLYTLYPDELYEDPVAQNTRT